MTGPVFHDDVLKLLLPGVFGELSDAAFRDILPHLELRELRFREVLFESGDPGDSMYILVSGRLEAYLRAADGAETIIGPVIPGESVGEMGLLTGDVASACVRALRDSVLLRISAENFARSATPTRTCWPTSPGSSSAGCTSRTRCAPSRSATGPSPACRCRRSSMPSGCSRGWRSSCAPSGRCGSWMPSISTSTRRCERAANRGVSPSD
jgi:hypothetical protein